MKRALVFASVLFAACGGATKTEVTDDFSNISDEKSDSFSQRMQIVGQLSDAQGSVDFAYSAQPIYRAIKFHALTGDLLKIIVNSMTEVKVKGGRSTTADPVTFLLDSKFKVIAKNDDAFDGTRDSMIFVKLRKSGTFYAVVRDYNYASENLHAEISMARVSGDLIADANAWFAFFFQGDNYGLTDQFAVPNDQMPQAAQDDANGFFKSDVGGASGFALPYDGTVMYMLTGGADGEAYDARPYDADGNPIADTAIGGDAGEILFK
jgi:hypothetical protein